jgi:hypothetical protein
MASLEILEMNPLIMKDGANDPVPELLDPNGTPVIPVVG